MAKAGRKRYTEAQMEQRIAELDERIASNLNHPDVKKWRVKLSEARRTLDARRRAAAEKKLREDELYS